MNSLRLPMTRFEYQVPQVRAFLCVLAVATISALFCDVADAQPDECGAFEVIKLGSVNLEGLGIASDGTAVIGNYIPTNGPPPHAFVRVSGSGFRPIGVLGSLGSRAYGVSADGSAVVGQSFDSAGTKRTFLWTARDGSIALPVFESNVFLAGVSGGGTVLVGTGPIWPGHAVRWTPASGFEDLGTLGGTYGFATAVSLDGSVIVGKSFTAAAGQPTHAFRWTAASGIQDLGCLSDDPYASSGATAISADGKVIVGQSWTDDGILASFRWTETEGMRSLGTIDGFTSYMPASASADGSVIVGYAGNSFTPSLRAFRWTQSGGIQDLGLPASNYYKAAASGISMDGRAIVGTVNVNGSDQAFYWHNADLDGDGFITGTDFDLFVEKYVHGDHLADFNIDGKVTAVDFDEFVNAFLLGC